MKLVVAGAAGKIALGTILCLLKEKDVEQIVCADIQMDKLKAMTAKIGDKRLVCQYIDFRNVRGTAKVFTGCDVVVNCGYQGYTTDKPYIDYALLAMEAALEAGVNYTDLGGITPSPKILSKEFSDQFKKKGILAIPGIGEAPGVNQVMAAYAINKMKTVSSIDMFWGEKDLVPPEEHSRLFHWPFTMGGLRSIVTAVPCKAFENGKIIDHPSCAGQQVVQFSEPIGGQLVAETTGEPMLALIRSFSNKGIQHASWKVALDPILVFCRDIGLMGNEPIDVKDQRVVPWDVFTALLNNLPPETKRAPMFMTEGRVLVKGVENGKNVEYLLVMRPNVAALEEYSAKGVSGELTTGVAIAVAGLMIGRGQIKGTGIIFPELCLPPEEYLDEFRSRGMEVEITKKIIL